MLRLILSKVKKISFSGLNVFYSSQDTGFILFQLKRNPFPNNLTPEIVSRKFMWLLAWKMFFTTDKISTQQHKNGRQRSTVKITKNDSLNCLNPFNFYLWPKYSADNYQWSLQVLLKLFATKTQALIFW